VFKDKKYVLIMVDPDAGEAADVLHWMVTDIEVIVTCLTTPLAKQNWNVMKKREKENNDFRLNKVFLLFGHEVISYN